MNESFEDNEVSTVRPKRSVVKFVLLFFVLVVGVVCFLLWYGSKLMQPPTDFPINQPITIEVGTTVRAITEQLAEAEVVRSAELLYLALAFLHNPADIKASTYVFDEPLSVLLVAERLTEGDFDSTLVRFTHIEGETVRALATRAGIELDGFNEDRFLLEALPLEGTLYPETYFIPKDYSADELVSLLYTTYQETMAPLQEKIIAHPLSEREVIILASILEREANSPESKKMVSGILQNRLAIGMALQADATIEYVIDTPLNELPPGQLAEELKELDSPYNTYLYPGLPPTAIGNPGLEAITAVLEPTESPYLYYITGNDGEFYYAETYDEHLANIERHLR